MGRSRIHPALLARIRQQLGLSQARVYQLIGAKARATHLPTHLAAIALATERGISVSKYATEEQLAQIRQTASLAAPAAVAVPVQPPTETRPRRAATKTARHAKSSVADRRGTTVFVVHGRDKQFKDAMFTFLRALELRPLEWSEAVKLTGQPTPYVGTVLDTAFRVAAAVVVLLTPDDEAQLREVLRSPHDPRYESQLTGQARPNVLFEAGMAFGRNPDNTVLVQSGDVRPFSDVAGRHILRLGNDATSKQQLALRLADAGCNVNTNGTDWLTAGDFTLTPNRPRRRRR
jgi:predicted nucleotide-binding protein